MKRSTTTWTLAVTAAALLMLPASGAAQTPPSPPSAAQPPAAAQPQPPAADTAAAREHLAKAKLALNEIQAPTLNAKAKTQVAELKRRINTLERSIGANDEASATGTGKRSPTATAGAKGKVNWGTEVAAIDKTLTMMLGPDSATGAPATTGTSGTAAAKSKAAAAALDEPTRAKLTEVRTHITAFATAMAGGKPKTEPAPDPSAAEPTAPPASPAAQPANPAAAPSTPAAAQPTPETAPQAAQPDEQAARRHLTEARNTLSALTQLPAASQLSGEARTQVSQLISNFNELITTQNEWRGSYAKVSATLTALLGPAGMPEPASASGTAGAVGTSGTSTVSLDPTVREKLVELRRQLSEFEKAAGGGSAAPVSQATPDPNAPPATPPTATPPSSTPPSTTPPSATPPSTTPPTATPPATAPPSATPATPETTPAPQSAAGNAEIMRHIAAIEVLLKMEDESGGLTLTKAQVEQLRSHWAALKQALDKR